MRYLFGFLCVCALGVVPAVGCLKGPWFEDPCQGVVCPTDGNECTYEYCDSSTGRCYSVPADNGTGCDIDGIAGVCVEGMCGENLCEGVVCDDGIGCTDDTCDYVDGTCEFTPVECDDLNECTEDTCDPADGCRFTPVEDGTLCFGGVCTAGACELPTDACTNAEDLAVVCDPGFADGVETCTDPSACCVAECLVEETGVSAGCATCYGEALRCISDNCAAVCDAALDSQACKDCGAENGCDTLLVNCTGDLANAC